ncbi:MAG: Nif3-like dinuclear metal center hexameric protein [Chitinophagales bacterium]|nr:Nif3-like dinuclear metal center hexameric protein [Chitinophagales bacterium]
MKLKELTSFLEQLAPPSLQESYDNSGLLVGNPNDEINKAIVCLDCIEAVVDEAIAKKADVIIAHHPIIFGGLKRLNGNNYVERTIIKAIKHNIALYAIHTNLDNVMHGVNAVICKKLGLKNTQILLPKADLLYKLITFAPKENAEDVRQALFDAEAGQIGNYHEASFNTEGIGTFKGMGGSNPAIGKQGVQEQVNEIKIEVLLEKYKLPLVLQTLFKAHPYEEVAYDVVPLKNMHQQMGSGMIGVLEKPMKTKDFMVLLKEQFGLKVIRHTGLVKDKVQSIAVCGGSGSFLLKEAKAQKADVFITADFKYHEFFDAENQLIIMDIGHYESEQFTSSFLLHEIRKKFPKFAVLLTEINTNPVQYYI